MTAPLLVIAAGGTGGHMFPAQALAEAMLERGWRVTLSTDPRGARYAGGFPAAVTRSVVNSATPSRGGAAGRLAMPFRIAGGVWSAWRAMRRDRPALVAGFGGYPSIPALVAAGMLGVPRLIHEQNGVLGDVNRRFAARVDAVACGTWPTALPEGVEGIHTGNPVRAAIAERAAAPYIAPGDYPMSVLVFGGSQGARVLADMVPAALAALPAPMRGHLRVSQQARDEDRDRVVAAYAAAGIPAEVSGFFADIPARLVEAQLVIARAGASSVADISAIGRPSILIPYPHATADHQSANAAGLARAGAAEVVQERDLGVESLSALVAGILGMPARAIAMAVSAQRAGVPDATARLAALVERLAEGKKEQTA